VCAVDDVSIAFFVKGGLGAEFAAKEFGGVWRNGRLVMTVLVGNGRVYVHVGGLLSARAISDILGTTVLIPLPLPSILVIRTGILGRTDESFQ